MKQYLDLLADVMRHGVDKDDRTGTGTRSVFGRQLRFDLAQGFPLLTTKKVHLKSIIYELLWFLHGDLGPVYGHQWRSWPDYSGGTIDQIAQVVDQLRHNPDSRRMIVSAWNVAEVSTMALPPCHSLFQFYVAQGRLSLQLYQRSADLFLGVPFNIASYSLLLLMMAQVTGLQPGEFIHTFGDAHIYRNHFEQVELQLTRTPRQLPVMHLNPAVSEIDGFDYDDFTLEGYDPYPLIKGVVSV